MKKLKLLSASLSVLILASCSSSDDKSETARPADTAKITEEAAPDTTAVNNIPFEVQKFEKQKGDNELEIEYPVKGNPELVKSVQKWMSEMLTNTYRGDMNDPEAFFRHYSAQLGEDPDLNEYGGYTKDDFEVEYINDYVLTYDYTSYIYEGGAHGMGGTYGTSFLQSDGTIFTKECFTSYEPMRSLFIKGLKQYFKVQTDDELKECLMGNSLSTLSPPGMDPWIVEEGVVFSYTPYEIAPYSAGSPNFTIPYSELEPYLTEQGKKFFGK